MAYGAQMTCKWASSPVLLVRAVRGQYESRKDETLPTVRSSSRSTPAEAASITGSVLSLGVQWLRHSFSSICLLVRPSVCLFVCSVTLPSGYLYSRLAVCLFTNFSVCLGLCVCVCVCKDGDLVAILIVTNRPFCDNGDSAYLYQLKRKVTIPCVCSYT